MAENKQRKKFTNDRTFSMEEDRFVESVNSSDNEEGEQNLSGIGLIEDEDILEGNVNQNAQTCLLPCEEGEASSDSDVDLRKVIQSKQGNGGAACCRKLKTNPSFSNDEHQQSKEPMPSTSRDERTLE